MPRVRGDIHGVFRDWGHRVVCSPVLSPIVRDEQKRRRRMSALENVKAGDEIFVFEEAELFRTKAERVTRFYVLARGRWYRKSTGYRRGRDRYTSRGALLPGLRYD